MNISPEEAVVIYARACRSWFGSLARDKIAERIAQLAKAGDHNGANTYQQVHLQVCRLENEAGTPQYREDRAVRASPMPTQFP